jgi:3',5'-cyclic AMP phosphodiesterase CpdA
MATFYGSVPNDSFRILVVHHHLTELDALFGHDLAQNARETLQEAADLNVDMILCGHLHISHVAHVENVRPGHSIVVCTAGTATSDRGRGTNTARNFYNRIVLTEQDVTIEEREYDVAGRKFAASTSHKFARPRRSN